MQDFRVKALWKDEEITGRIYCQYSELKQFLMVTEEQKNAVLLTLISCMTKLSAVKYHLSNYQTTEEQLHKSIQTKVLILNKPLTDIDEEYRLIFEIESFLFQFKSSLDMLVKILCPILNLQPGQISSFGENGSSIIKTLNNQSKKKYEHSRILELIHLISEEKDTWLKFAIGLRNKVSHYESLRDISFRTFYSPNGKVEVMRPTIDKMYVGDSLETLAYNLLTFHQDFLGLAFQLVFPPFIGLRINTEEDCKQLEKEGGYKQFARFIKWNVGVKNEYIGTFGAYS